MPILKGDIAVGSSYLFPSFNPKFFDRPAEFDPMRWLDSENKLKKIENAY